MDAGGRKGVDGRQGRQSDASLAQRPNPLSTYRTRSTGTAAYSFLSALVPATQWWPALLGR